MNISRMETQRLVIRHWDAFEFYDFLSFASDPDVMPLAGSKCVSDNEDGRKEFEKILKNDSCYAITLKETGKPIGSIKFQKDIRRYNMNSLSIGYELAKKYWGKGYMTEALRAMVKTAFEVRKVEILGIGHFSVNERSRRVIEKCGFYHEGTIRKGFMRYDGVIFDDESYSITREEYLNNMEQYNTLDSGHR